MVCMLSYRYLLEIKNKSFFVLKIINKGNFPSVLLFLPINNDWVGSWDWKWLKILASSVFFFSLIFVVSTNYNILRVLLRNYCQVSTSSTLNPLENSKISTSRTYIKGFKAYWRSFTKKWKGIKIYWKSSWDLRISRNRRKRI